MIRAATSGERKLVAMKTGGDDAPPVCLIYEEAGQILAGCIVEAYSGTNCFVHYWADTPAPNFLSFCLHYIFVELGCSRFTGVVDKSNTKAVNFNLKLGGQVEGQLADASLSGDVLLFCHSRATTQHLWSRYG